MDELVLFFKCQKCNNVINPQGSRSVDDGKYVQLSSKRTSLPIAADQQPPEKMRKVLQQQMTSKFNFSLNRKMLHL